MTRVVILVLLLFCIRAIVSGGGGVYAQYQEQDALRIQAAGLDASDPQYVEVMGRIGNVFNEKRPDSAAVYYDRAAAAAELQKNDSLHAFYRVKSADVYYRCGQHRVAVEAMMPAIQYYEQQRDSLQLGNLYFMLGSTQTEAGQIEDGLKALNVSLRIASNQQDSATLMRVYVSMALTYDDIGQRTQAYKINAIALRLGRENPRLRNQYIFALNNEATYLMEDARLTEAMPFIQKSIEEASMLSDSSIAIVPWYTQGEIYMAMGEKSRAVQAFRNAVRIARQYVDDEYKYLALEAMSIVHLLEENQDSSAYYFRLTMDYGTARMSLADQIYSLDTRIGLLDSRGDYEQAFRLLQQRNVLQDSFVTTQRIQEAKETQMLIDMREKDAENKVLRESNEKIDQSRKLAWWLLGGIGALGITIVLLITLSSLRSRRLYRLITAKNTILGETNRRLVRLSEDKEILMGIVAHDLRSPLSKVQGLTSILPLSGPLTPEQEDILGKMHRMLDSGKALIADVLLISSLDSEQEDKLVAVDIGAALTEAANLYEQAARQKRIQLSMNLNGGPVLAMANSEYLLRILDNLISNAIKFSREGTEVRLSIGRDDKNVWCTIADQGPGIDPREMDKLFKRFARLSNRPTGGETSTGLGLYIVKTLADRMKGRILVDSTLGVGTVFRLSLQPA